MRRRRARVRPSSSRWLALLAIGAVLIGLLYRRGFRVVLPMQPAAPAAPMSGREWRALAITAGASLLWLTDSIHGLHPVAPPMIAWICLLSPRIGVLSRTEFERSIGWTSFFVLAASMSLAAALIDSSAGGCIAGRVVQAMPAAGDAVLYYPAQSASSLVGHERGYLTAPEIFRSGIWMTLVAFAVVLLVALPYWAAGGEPLRLPQR